MNEIKRKTSLTRSDKPLTAREWTLRSQHNHLTLQIRQLAIKTSDPGCNTIRQPCPSTTTRTNRQNVAKGNRGTHATPPSFPYQKKDRHPRALNSSNPEKEPWQITRPEGSPVTVGCASWSLHPAPDSTHRFRNHRPSPGAVLGHFKTTMTKKWPEKLLCGVSPSLLGPLSGGKRCHYTLINSGVDEAEGRLDYPGQPNNRLQRRPLILSIKQSKLVSAFTSI